MAMALVVLLQGTTLFMMGQKSCHPSFIGMISFETPHGKPTQYLAEFSISLRKKCFWKVRARD
jgi:hypothetical protein